MTIPSVQITMNSPNSFAFYRFFQHNNGRQAKRSDGHHKAEDCTKLRSFCKQGFRNGNRAENIRIYWNTHQHG